MKISSRLRTTGAALLASAALVAGVVTAPSAVADPPNRTPHPDEVLNDFVEEAFATGRPASPDELITPLVTISPFYDEPELTGREAPGTLLKSERLDVQFAGIQPGNIAAYRLMYVTTTIPTWSSDDSGPVRE